MLLQMEQRQQGKILVQLKHGVGGPGSGALTAESRSLGVGC